MSHFVYILLCADKTFYIGSTTDLPRRLHQHNHAKAGAHYTKIRRPVVLVYSQKMRTLARVRAREAELKRLTKKEKTLLVEKSRKAKPTVHTKAHRRG